MGKVVSGTRDHIACCRLSVVGDGEKGRAREKNEGGLRRGRKGLALVLPGFFLARFRSSPTTESLEQARHHITGASQGIYFQMFRDYYLTWPVMADRSKQTKAPCNYKYSGLK